MPESPSMEREEWSHLPIIDGKVGEGVKFERIRRITGYLGLWSGSTMRNGQRCGTG